MASTPDVAILGPLTAAVDHEPVGLGTPRQRAVLSALIMRRGMPSPAETLAELVWGDARPPSYENTLQGHIARLRRTLEPDRPPRTPASVVVYGPGGYALRSVDVDADRFERWIDDVHREMNAHVDQTGLLPQVTTPRAEELVDRLDRALAQWRGVPFAELPDAPEAATARGRLEQFRLLALQDRAALEIRLGREGRAVADLEALTTSHPLREPLWSLRALALARIGRQGEALHVLGEVRRLLAEDLGVDPGHQVVGLQRAILTQDPGLHASPRHRHTKRPVDGAPLVGREVELSRLVALHDEVVAAVGPPRFATITGEPGVGKSRLIRAVSAHADAAGARVVVTSCPEDQGCPPLWAWAQLLTAMGSRLPAVPPSQDAGAQFRTWHACVDVLLDAVGERPTVVVVDDLQWADPSTVRALALLADSVRTARLVVVLSWRTGSTTAGLHQLAGTLGRHHALQVPLTGLSATETARLVAGVGDGLPELSWEQARRWRDRTGGNPFFLVELARLRRADDDELADPTTSTVIQDVIAQRLAELPDVVTQVLRTAAVLGRDIEVDALAAVTDHDDGDVVGALELALGAGLVVEVDVDRFRFAHDLLQESIRDGVTHTRRARVHARAAQLLSCRGLPGQESDVARHWLAAGPTHADQAWRAARAAAVEARRTHAYEESTGWLHAALDAVDRDAAALPEDRCDLLLELAESTRLAGRWSAVRPVVHAALGVAHRLGDPERAFTAATLPTHGALWLASPYGEVDQIVVGALRQLLLDLPAGDDPWRCQVMLSLASEIYYTASAAERDALVDEAIAMAHRLADRELQLRAYLGGARSVWRSSRSSEQHRLAARAVELARHSGDQLALADGLATLAAVDSDLGLTEDLFSDLADARGAAQRQRLLFNAVVVDGIELGWRALRGETVHVERLATGLTTAVGQMEMAQLADTLVATQVVRLLWSERYRDLLEMLLTAEPDIVTPVQTFVAALLGRTGRLDDAVSFIASRDLRLDVDDWLSPAVWAMAAEASMHVGDHAMAARMYERLAPLAGRPATAGPAAIVGPVDMFLAMAARAVGEHTTAHRHADDAERVAKSWVAEPVVRWVRAVRARWQVADQA